MLELILLFELYAYLFHEFINTKLRIHVTGKKWWYFYK